MNTSTPQTMSSTDGSEKLPRLQKKLFDLLSTGGKYSAADISIRLHLCDPRGHIAVLRAKGFNIRDEWREGDYGVRYKVYFL